MKTISTVHRELGYSNNVRIIADALGTYFGFTDSSDVQTAVAAHIWSSLSHPGDVKAWGDAEIRAALIAVRARVDRLEATLPGSAPATGLRLKGLVRRHSCGGTALGVDVALLDATADDGGEPLAVFNGPRAPEVVQIITAAVNQCPVSLTLIESWQEMRSALKKVQGDRARLASLLGDDGDSQPYVTEFDDIIARADARGKEFGLPD